MEAKVEGGEGEGVFSQPSSAREEQEELLVREKLAGAKSGDNFATLFARSLVDRAPNLHCTRREATSRLRLELGEKEEAARWGERNGVVFD